MLGWTRRMGMPWVDALEADAGDLAAGDCDNVDDAEGEAGCDCAGAADVDVGSEPLASHAIIDESTTTTASAPALIRSRLIASHAAPASSSTSADSPYEPIQFAACASGKRGSN